MATSTMDNGTIDGMASGVSASGGSATSTTPDGVRHRNSSPAAGESTGRPKDSSCNHDQDDMSNKASSSKEGTTEQPEPDNSRFECNICLDVAKNAVISMCGHLFCWPCLHQWLETRPNRQTCPVCKSAISREKVIPLYGRNSDNKDPRDTVPPRPQGQRTEAPQGFPGFNWGGNGGEGGGFHFSFGIGAFPFTLFTTNLNFGERRPGPPNRGTTQHQEEQMVSRSFIIMAFLFMFWLIFLA